MNRRQQGKHYVSGFIGPCCASTKSQSYPAQLSCSAMVGEPLLRKRPIFGLPAFSSALKTFPLSSAIDILCVFLDRARSCREECRCLFPISTFPARRVYSVPSHNNKRHGAACETPPPPLTILGVDDEEPVWNDARRATVLRVGVSHDHNARSPTFTPLRRPTHPCARGRSVLAARCHRARLALHSSRAVLRSRSLGPGR